MGSELDANLEDVMADEFDWETMRPLTTTG
jgi:hypothetical protein